MAFTAQNIIDACSANFEKYKGDCSGFVKAAAANLGVALTGRADDIVAAIEMAWIEIPTGLQAWETARTGKLVIAGLKSGDHSPPKQNGHVVIIAPVLSSDVVARNGGDLYRSKYPVVWGGCLNGPYYSNGNKSVGEVWSRTDRDKVLYRAFPTA